MTHKLRPGQERVWLGRPLDKRKLAVEAGSAAIGLAGLAYSLHELQKRKASRPQMLLDERALTFHDGAYVKAAAAVLGGPAVMTAEATELVTGLKPSYARQGLLFLKDHGLVVGETMESHDGENFQHYMAASEFFAAVCASPEKYAVIVDYACEYYPDFSLEALQEMHQATFSPSDLD